MQKSDMDMMGFCFECQVIEYYTHIIPISSNILKKWNASMERGTMAKKWSNLEWSTMLFAHPWNGRTVEYQWAND